MCLRHHVRRNLCLLALCSLVLSAAQASRGGAPLAAAQTSAGTIAYVRGSTSDEIRLIEPDGSGDRRLWAHGLPDPHNVYGIYNMAWRPDGRELAFASTHENWCSINYSDVFAIGSGGGGYRRITQAPACAALAGYPKGTVRVPVKNVSVYGTSFTGFVYFQGAPSILPVSLPAGASTVLTFSGVADFGPGALQIAAAIDGANREYSVSTAVDVEAGRAVTAGELAVTTPRNMGQEPRSPTWRSDGATLGYAYGYASLYGISVNPGPVAFGTRLINPAVGPNIVEYMAYGPSTSRRRQILYQGYDIGTDAIYLVTEGSTQTGELLVSSEEGLFRGLAWLPDGSGFVYSLQEYANYDISRANLFEYRFATRRSQRLTNFDSSFVGQMSVSPDGQEIVFERAATKESDAATDLWVIERGSGTLRPLIRDAASPAWSPGALPPPLTPRAYLPLLQR